MSKQSIIKALYPIMEQYDIDVLAWGQQYAKSRIWIREDGVGKYTLNIKLIRGMVGNEDNALSQIEGIMSNDYITDYHDIPADTWEIGKEIMLVKKESSSQHVLPHKPLSGVTQNFYAPVHGDVNTGETIHTERTTSNAIEEAKKKKWYEHTVVNWVIGVLTALLTGYILWKLGWN